MVACNNSAVTPFDFSIGHDVLALFIDYIDK